MSLHKDSNQNVLLTMLKLSKDRLDHKEPLRRSARDDLALDLSQQLEGSVFPDGEHQCSKEEYF
jgi:hypothetical protein